MTAGTPFWLAGPSPAPAPPLRGVVEADVAIVGAGFAGLWTALELKRRDSALKVVVCEAETVAFGASGRNGGFYDPSLTHGLANGVHHFGNEITELERLAAANDRGFTEDLRAWKIDCDYEATGQLDVATEPWQVAELREDVDLHLAHGHRAELLDARQIRERLDSPRFLAGSYRPDAGGVLDPVKLARGLARAAVEQGVVLHERTPIRHIARRGGRVRLDAARGAVDAERVVLATNVWTDRLLRRTRRAYVPVYDYVLVTEPLGDRLHDLGWKGREGISDSGNQFHYFRLTADDRMLWGGYEAVYHYRNGVHPRYDVDSSVFELLSRHLFDVFPQLRGVRFDYRWGGAIDTSTRFTPTFGTAFGGRVAYAVGFTGLGVGATRWAGGVLSDLLLDPSSPVLSLRAVRRQPFPFPPEPLRWVAVSAVRRSLAWADAHDGRRNALLRTLDRLKIGFDS